MLTAIGIPFILAGTFWVLHMVGETLNIMVLLGIVISLGMLVDDAVVVVESIYYRLQRGMKGLDAAIDALREVGKPVTSAVSTTMANFSSLPSSSAGVATTAAPSAFLRALERQQ